MGPLSLLAEGELALGDMHETVSIFGVTSISTTASNTPTTPFVTAGGFPANIGTGAPAVNTTTNTVTAGGMFAQATNGGRYSRDFFAIVPEVTLKVGYDVTQHLRASVGYNFLYMNQVARPGALIDRSINPALLGLPSSNAGVARPLFVFNESDFWAQGVNLSMEIRF
jgi:hypothetical protein